MSNLQWEWLHCYLFGLDWIVKVGCRHWWHGENNTAWVSLADGWWLIYSRLFLWMTVKYTSWQERMVTLTLYFYTFQRIYINEKVNERWMKRLNTSPVLSLKKWTHWFTGRYTYSADVFNLFQTEINTTSKQSKWTCDVVTSWFGKVSHYQRIAFLIPFISFKGPWCKKNPLRNSNNHKVMEKCIFHTISPMSKWIPLSYVCNKYPATARKQLH